MTEDEKQHLFGSLADDLYPGLDRDILIQAIDDITADTDTVQGMLRIVSRYKELQKEAANNPPPLNGMSAAEELVRLNPGRLPELEKIIEEWRGSFRLPDGADVLIEHKAPYDPSK